MVFGRIRVRFSLNLRDGRMSQVREYRPGLPDIKKEGGNRLPAEFTLAFGEYIADLPKSDQVAPRTCLLGLP